VGSRAASLPSRCLWRTFENVIGGSDGEKARIWQIRIFSCAPCGLQPACAGCVDWRGRNFCGLPLGTLVAIVVSTCLIDSALPSSLTSPLHQCSAATVERTLPAASPRGSHTVHTVGALHIVGPECYATLLHLCTSASTCSLRLKAAASRICLTACVRLIHTLIERRGSSPPLVSPSPLSSEALSKRC
jgi:hypothetical protein